MVKNTFFGKTLFLFLVSCFLSQNSTAQLYNAGNLMVHNGGELHVSNTFVDFSNSNAITLTSRTPSSNGSISFSALAITTNSSNNHYVDGYVKFYGNVDFIAPVGDNNVLAPVKVDPENVVGVEVAYFRNSPSTFGNSLAGSIETILPNEYWIIKGGDTKISLSWRDSSDLASYMLTPSLSFLTIVGYNGAQWVEIPSFYDTTSFLGTTSDITQGSISTLDVVNPNNFQAFSLAIKQNATCFPIVVSSGMTKIWNGSNWIPSSPSLNDPVIINQPFTGSLSCFSIVLNANLIIGDNDIVEVVEGFSGSGKVIMSSEASLLQRSSTGTPPIIEMTKITNPMRRLDYTFLSSPLANFATFFSDVNSPNKTAVNGQFGQFQNSAFYNFFTDSNTGASQTVTSTNVPVGRGFAATVRFNQGPFNTSTSSGAWFTEKFPIYIKTEGLTNNGNINVPFPTNTNWGRIGNPYPSPINGEKLLDALSSSDFRKTIYFWTFNTPRQNFATLPNNYNPADYATFNYSGGVAACANCQVPTGIIPTMQSVYIRKETGSSATSIPLTNCLRDLTGNDIFFRTASSSNGRLRLNLIGSENSFSQILIAYNLNTTEDYDNGFDSPRMPGATTSEINSLIVGLSSGFAIQTRGPFDISDEVPLQIIKRVNESFTINLATKDGVFTDGSIPIYLHDKQLNVFHDLNQGGYSFIQNLSEVNNRFELVYQASTLGINDNNLNPMALAYIENQVLSAQSSSSISSIEVYDLTGRLLHWFKEVNSSMFTAPFIHPQSVFIAKIRLNDGTIIDQKLINR